MEGRAWPWAVGAILLLGLIGGLFGDEQAPAPGSSARPVATFADGSQMPPDMIEAGEICDSLYPSDDTEFVGCVLRLMADDPRATPPATTHRTTTTAPEILTTAQSTAPTMVATTAPPGPPPFEPDPNEPAPPTSEPIFLQSGLGVVSIGDPSSQAIPILTGIHGPPTRDTGWEPSFSSFGTCPGIQARLMEWGSLEVVFVITGETLEYSPFILRADPEGVVLSISEWASGQPLWRHPTWYGIAVGDTVGDLLATYGPRAELFEEPQFGSFAFTIDAAEDGDAWGRVTGTTTGFALDDQITSLHVGAWCGE